MKRTTLSFLLFLFFHIAVTAQKPWEILNSYGDRSPIEKIYLHLDRENYLAGETIWFKAYLYSEFLPDTISTVAYVELRGPASNLISRKILPVLFGFATGEMELPDSVHSGMFTIRAYTTTMLNHDPDFHYHREIFVYGKKSNTPPPKEKLTRIEFFPESGNFISGEMNTLAFKVTDERGMPMNIQGQVKNNKGEVVASLESIHDGMGIFDLRPASGESYYATITDGLSEKRFPLPAAIDRGIVFRVMPDPQGRYFELIQDKSDPAFRASYIIGQMQHHTVFKLEVPQGTSGLTGIIKTAKLSSGIMQITVFNRDHMPLAERLVFIDNKEYILQAELALDTLNFSPKGKNKYTLSMCDTVIGSFSVAITDYNYDLHTAREENIYSRLLLSADLKGTVNNPAWYFSSDDDSVKNAMDLVMMTNGWRRFKWSDMARPNQIPSNFKDPGYITVSGRVMIANTRRPFANLPFMVFITSPDSSQMMLMSATDAQGYFRLDSVVFYERSRILFKDIRGRKSSLLDVRPGPDSISRSWGFPKPPSQGTTLGTGNGELDSKFSQDLDAIQKVQGIMLKGITVKTRKKSPIQELEEKYASDLFTGFSERTIDLLHSEEPLHMNIFDYLDQRVPGIQVVRDGIDYGIYYRQGPTASTMGPVPMTIYLDEILTDASFVSTINADQVAMVKVFSNFVGAVGGGPGGVLAIYTKKGADTYNSQSSNDHLTYRGFSVAKEFYSPNYEVNKDSKNKTDNRITLQWQPNIFIASLSPAFPIRFYNNDRTRQVRVVVEGMTTNGKMLMIEKIIPSQRGF